MFDGSHTWIKKQGGFFNMTVDDCDGTKVGQPVGTYMLNLLF